MTFDGVETGRTVKWENPLISKPRLHAVGHLVEIVTAERPTSRIVGLERNPHAAHRRHQNRARTAPWIGCAWIEGVSQIAYRCPDPL